VILTASEGLDMMDGIAFAWDTEIVFNELVITATNCLHYSADLGDIDSLSSLIFQEGQIGENEKPICIYRKAAARNCAQLPGSYLIGISNVSTMIDSLPATLLDMVIMSLPISS